MAPRKQAKRPAKVKRKPVDATGYDPELCKRGDHPSTRKVGTVCMACGTLDAWSKR